jgi:hypothetical protein
MKKRTVITTETHEVWVIQRSHESSQENDDAAVRTPEDSQGDTQSLTAPAEQTQTEEAPPPENE